MHNDDYKILQVLDQSACLSKSQLLGYMNRSLYPEELRAVELHLSRCTLCNDALEGFEAIQHAENLIASMAPPVLPAIILPEKPAEKKEPEPQPAYVPSKKRSRAKVNAETIAQEHNKYNSNPQSFWFRTIGIAAALIIGFGLIWYYEWGSSVKTENLSQNIPASAEMEPPLADTVNTQSIASLRADTLQMAAEKKAKDSVYLAALKAEKLKQQKDSLSNTMAARKADTTADNADKPLLAANEKEETTIQEEPSAKKQSAAPAAAMAPKKEEDTKAKAVKSDFELGMQQYKQNNFASALLYFKTAESNDKDPKHWEAVYLSGMCNKSLDRKRKAVKYFERVVAAKAPQAKAAQKQLDDLNKKDSK